MTTLQHPPVKRRKVNTIYLGAIGENNDNHPSSNLPGRSDETDEPSTSAAINFASLHQATKVNERGSDIVKSHVDFKPTDDYRNLLNEAKNSTPTADNSCNDFSMDSDVFVLAAAKNIQRSSITIENETVEMPKITKNIKILPRQVSLGVKHHSDDVNIIEPPPPINKDVVIDLKIRNDSPLCSIKASVSTPHASGLKCGNVSGRSEQLQKYWELLLQSSITIVEANHNWTLVACENRQLNIIKTRTGKQSRVLRLPSPIAFIMLHEKACLVLLSNAMLSTWNLETNECIAQTSLAAALRSSSDMQISHCAISDSGIPMVLLSNGECVVHSKVMNAWLTVSVTVDPISKLVQSLKFIADSIPNGLLAVLTRQRASSMAKTNFDAAINASCEETQFEALIAACQAVESWVELSIVFGIYARNLLKRDKRAKLVEALEDLSMNINQDAFHDVLQHLKSTLREYDTTYEKLKSQNINNDVNLSFIE